VLNEVARRWRFRTVAPDDEATLRQLDAGAALRRLGVPGWKLPLIAADLRRRQRRDIDAIRPFDGVPAMLEALAGAGLALAIVSSNAGANVEHVLGPRLCSLIPVRDCGSALGGKHRRLRRLLQRTGVPPERSLYIGDEVRDMVAAHRVGMAAGAVAWGYNGIEVLRRSAPALEFLRVEDITLHLAGASCNGGTRARNADPRC
jgi:phosphoglycolate phosphatase